MSLEIKRVLAKDNIPGVVLKYIPKLRIGAIMVHYNQMAVPEKLINNKRYPVILIDGRGGKFVIQQGEVVPGQFFNRIRDYRKGIVPYNGPREVGIMQNIGLTTHEQKKNAVPVKTNNVMDQIPGMTKPRVDGAQHTEIIPNMALLQKYKNKSVGEWKTESETNGLMSYARGELVGLGRYMGLNLPQNAQKQDLVKFLGDAFKAMDNQTGINQTQPQQNPNYYPEHHNQSPYPVQGQYPGQVPQPYGQLPQQAYNQQVVPQHPNTLVPQNNQYPQMTTTPSPMPGQMPPRQVSQGEIERFMANLSPQQKAQIASQFAPAPAPEQQPAPAQQQAPSAQKPVVVDSVATSKTEAKADVLDDVLNTTNTSGNKNKKKKK